LKAWFGWKTSSEADLYTEAAEREKAARDAAALKRRTPIGKLKKKFAKNVSTLLKSLSMQTRVVGPGVVTPILI